MSVATRHPLGAILVLALVLRILVALIAYELFGQSPVLDDETYSTMAEQASIGFTNHWDDHTRFLYNRTATLMVPLTALYSLFGPHQFLGQMFIALIGAITAVAGTRLAMEILPPLWAVGAGLILALLPSQVLWSSLILKDALVWLLLIALALVIATASRTSGWRLLFLAAAAVIALLLLVYLRQHTFVVACLAVALSGWFGIKAMRWSRTAGALLIGIALPWSLGLGPAGADFIQDGAASLEQLRVLNAVGAKSAFVEPVVPDAALPTPDAALPTPNAAFPTNDIAKDLDVPQATVDRVAAKLPDGLSEEETSEISQEFGLSQDQIRRVERAARQRLRTSPPGAALETEEDAALDPNIRHLPRGLTVMLVEPVPGQATESLSNSLAQLETIVWYPILFLALLGLPFLISRPDVAAFPLLVGGGILVMYALSEGNIGTAYRHRGEFVWVIALAAACGVARLMQWYRHRQAVNSAPSEEQGPPELPSKDSAPAMESAE